MENFGKSPLGSWLARPRVTKQIEGSFTAVASTGSASGRGCCIQHTLFGPFDSAAIYFGTLVMLRGMLECVTWHLHIGEVPATVWIGNAYGKLHLWISQIVIV